MHTHLWRSRATWASSALANVRGLFEQVLWVVGGVDDSRPAVGIARDGASHARFLSGAFDACLYDVLVA